MCAISVVISMSTMVRVKNRRNCRLIWLVSERTQRATSALSANAKRQGNNARGSQLVIIIYAEISTRPTD